MEVWEIYCEMLGLGGGSTKHAYKNKQTKIKDANCYYYFSKYHLRNARWSVKTFRKRCQNAIKINKINNYNYN